VGSTNAVSTVTCPAGTKLLGGGATVAQGNAVKAAVAISAPVSTTTWSATAVVITTGSGSASITASAICGS
jgi:hypothetical protein